VDNSAVYAYHCGIVTELVTFPPAAAIAIAAVAIAIVNTTVKTNMGSPIANEKSVEAA